MREWHETRGTPTRMREHAGCRIYMTDEWSRGIYASDRAAEAHIGPPIGGDIDGAADRVAELFAELLAHEGE